MRVSLAATMFELRLWLVPSTPLAVGDDVTLDFCLCWGGGGVCMAAADTGRDDVTLLGICVDLFFFPTIVDPEPIRFVISMSSVILSFHCTKLSLPRCEWHDRAISCCYHAQATHPSMTHTPVFPNLRSSESLHMYPIFYQMIMKLRTDLNFGVACCLSSCSCLSSSSNCPSIPIGLLIPSISWFCMTKASERWCVCEGRILKWYRSC